TAPTSLLPFSRLAIGLAIITCAGWLCRRRWALRGLLATACLALQGGFFAASVAARAEHPTPGVPLMEQHLEANGQSTRGNVTLYWPMGWINHIWFEVHANSYFEPMQIAGNVFNRETAVEGQRRALL